MPKKSASGFWSTAPGVITAIAALITAVGGFIAVVFGPNILAEMKKRGDHEVNKSPGGTLNPLPFGIELTAASDPQNAVKAADQVKSIAPKGAEIRLYKRITSKGTIAWAPVVLYTDSSVASAHRPQYEVNGWDPELVTIDTWCPNPRPITSPTGIPLTIPILDCT
jgi:hypothetical protein